MQRVKRWQNNRKPLLGEGFKTRNRCQRKVFSDEQHASFLNDTRLNLSIYNTKLKMTRSLTR